MDLINYHYICWPLQILTIYQESKIYSERNFALKIKLDALGKPQFERACQACHITYGKELLALPLCFSHFQIEFLPTTFAKASSSAKLCFARSQGELSPLSGGGAEPPIVMVGC